MLTIEKRYNRDPLWLRLSSEGEKSIKRLLSIMQIQI
jgi:hypothetical protein